MADPGSTILNLPVTVALGDTDVLPLARPSGTTAPGTDLGLSGAALKAIIAASAAKGGVFRGAWAANTAYGQFDSTFIPAGNPNAGLLAFATVAFTSPAAYLAGNWTLEPGQSSNNYTSPEKAKLATLTPAAPLYGTPGNNTDGAMTQAATTTALAAKLDKAANLADVANKDTALLNLNYVASTYSFLTGFPLSNMSGEVVNPPQTFGTTGNLGWRAALGAAYFFSSGGTARIYVPAVTTNGAVASVRLAANATSSLLLYFGAGTATSTVVSIGETVELLLMPPNFGANDASLPVPVWQVLRRSMMAPTGFNFRGTWLANTLYAQYDTVRFNGFTYYNIGAAFTSGAAFLASNWIAFGVGLNQVPDYFNEQFPVNNAVLSGNIGISFVLNGVSASPYDSTNLPAGHPFFNRLFAFRAIGTASSTIATPNCTIDGALSLTLQPGEQVWLKPVATGYTVVLDMRKGANPFTPITANQYGTHPAFSAQFALNAYLLGGAAPAGGPTVSNPTFTATPSITSPTFTTA